MEHTSTSEQKAPFPGGQFKDADTSFRLLDFLVVILQWKKPIIAFVVASTLLAAAVSFLLPKWYKSTATLVPPKSQGLFGGMAGLSSLIKDFAPVGVAGKLGSQAGGTNYLAILNSRRAGEAIVKRFDLMTEYGIQDGSMEKALKEFWGNYDVQITEDGSIKIEILDKDSVRAAKMTNGMVEVLNEIAIELGTSEARSNREFLDKRVADTRAELTAAEDRLKHFQETHGVMILSEDAKASANAVSELYARSVRADVELSILRKTTGVDNPAYQQLLLEKTELGKKLATFPELGIASFRLYRDLLIQQKIMEFLVPLAEQARIEEQRDVPVMMVLDKAVPAERKDRPKRLIIVGTAFLSALIMSLVGALLIVRWRIFRGTHPDQFNSLKLALRLKTTR